jgi:hypothetical protein
VEKAPAPAPDSLPARLTAVIHGALGALKRSARAQAESQLRAGLLPRLTEAMAAWAQGSRLNAQSFAYHFFHWDAADAVVTSLRDAAVGAATATRQDELAAASKHLADAMTAEGLDTWPRFIAHALERARNPATLAAVAKSLQPILRVSTAVGKPTSGSAGSGTKLAAAVESDPLKEQILEGGEAIFPHGGGAMPDIGPPAPQSDPVPPPVVQPVLSPARPAKVLPAKPATADKPASSSGQPASTAGTPESVSESGNLSSTQMDALRKAGLSDDEIAAQIKIMGDIQLFRGTSPGYPGNEVLQQFGITPASTDPAIATAFALKSQTTSGQGVVFTGSLRRFAHGSIDGGNTFASLEREVQVNMSPTAFEAQASTQIPANTARKILSEMGLAQLPSSIYSETQMTQILKSIKPLTPTQIKQFLQKAADQP